MPLVVGAVGAIIRMTCVGQDGDPVDMSAATLTNNLFLRNEQDRLLTKTPTLGSGGGFDGVVEYTTIAGDINLPGPWRAEMKIVIGGISLPTNVRLFQVDPPIYP